ncbi:MAG: flagellin [Candidatus Gastranaerophilales bacterium]|nr:flagellin [Candidatus Gastranaerophilales bacterium]
MPLTRTGSTFTYLQSYLNSHTSAYQDSMEQLSSGSKYNSVGDNPVAICKAEKLAVEIETSSTADTNIELGEDLMSMAETSQEDIISNLQRIYDLCIQAANGTYSANDKNEIIREIRARLDYIDSAADSTNFNDINLLDGSASALKLQTGTDANTRITIGDALIDVHTDILNVDLDPSITGENWTNQDIANYIDDIGAAISTITSASSKLGAYSNRLDTVSETLFNLSTNLTAKKSGLVDADAAEVSADLVKNQILQNASVSILVQMNGMQSLALSLFGD